MASIARLEDIKGDIAIAILGKQPVNKFWLSLPYDMVIDDVQHLIGMNTANFEGMYITVPKVVIVGKDRLYGFITYYDPNAEISLIEVTMAQADE